MEIQVGQEVFATKKALAERVRAILKRAPLGIELDPPAHDFLLSLFRRHPDFRTKGGCGIRGFRVCISPYGNRSFEIVRLDGTWTDFSYLKCITAKTAWSEFLSSLRHAVEDQVIEFRDRMLRGSEKEKIVCPLSGQTITKRTAHVDHEFPDTFDSLVGRFSAIEGIDREAPPIGPSLDQMIGRRLLDPALEERWKVFHQANAKLRLINADVHRRLKRKPSDTGLPYEGDPF